MRFLPVAWRDDAQRQLGLSGVFDKAADTVCARD
jgi:hypothetical protein